MITKHKLYNGEIELVFDDALHKYIVNSVYAQEMPVFGCSSATDVLDKPALKQWAANCGADFADAALKPGMRIDELNKPAIISGIKSAFRNRSREAMDIGTAVHKYLEEYLSAGINKEPLPEKPINELIRAAVDEFLNWSKRQGIKYVFSEKKIYYAEFINKQGKIIPLSKYLKLKKAEQDKYVLFRHYAGTFDFAGIADGKLDIGDFKTSNGIYSEYFVQVAPYAKALEDEAQYDKETAEKILRAGYTGKKIKVNNRWVLRVPKDGTDFGEARDHIPEFSMEAFWGCLKNYERNMYLKSEKVQEVKTKLAKLVKEKV